MIDLKNKLSFLNYIIFFLICLSFFYGYYVNENSGGGRIDEIHILNNFNIINNSSFFNIDWSRYESTSLPFYYLFFSFFFDELTIEKIRFLNFILSISTFLFFYILIKKKFNQINNDQVCLISSLILLSPYFRTSAFHALEENFAIFFVVTSLFF